MMKTDTTNRSNMKVISQDQDNVKHIRKPLMQLKQADNDKENSTSRTALKDIKLQDDKHDLKVKKIMHSKAIQTGEAVITEKDLTSDEPSEDYWRKLAETTKAALNDSCKEIEKLKDQNEALHEENAICKEMLNESRNLVEVLQEMISEKDGDHALEDLRNDETSDFEESSNS